MSSQSSNDNASCASSDLSKSLDQVPSTVYTICQSENKVTLSEDQTKNNQKVATKRETWSGKYDFFVSALAYAVGLGAVWRFPYLCYKNGGGVFLIPYFFFLLVIGVPLVFLEMAVGQFTSSGPLTCWRMAPFFRGLGISMNIVNTYFITYYNMILAYALYFLYYTFASVIGNELPWYKCNPKWSSESNLTLFLIIFIAFKLNKPMKLEKNIFFFKFSRFLMDF
jgi:SNF family Na+-dependent transporter